MLNSFAGAETCQEGPFQLPWMMHGAPQVNNLIQCPCQSQHCLEALLASKHMSHTLTGLLLQNSRYYTQLVVVRNLFAHALTAQFACLFQRN